MGGISVMALYVFLVLLYQSLFSKNPSLCKSICISIKAHPPFTNTKLYIVYITDLSVTDWASLLPHTSC